MRIGIISHLKYPIAEPFAGGLEMHTHLLAGVYDPPLQHFDDILRNATLFHGKWGVWPMTGWLDAFESMGLVRREMERIVRLRVPSAEEIRVARKADAAPF